MEEVTTGPVLSTLTTRTASKTCSNERTGPDLMQAERGHTQKSLGPPLPPPPTCPETVADTRNKYLRRGYVKEKDSRCSSGGMLQG